MVSGFVWQKTPEEAFTELADEYAIAIHTAVATLANRYKPEIEAWMKQNAPWQDRTGNARQTLYAEVDEVIGQSVTILLDHGVDYGIFLELAHAGRWAIIGPALDHFAPKIWADVKELFR